MLIGSLLNILSTTDENAVLRSICGYCGSAVLFRLLLLFTHPISRAFIGNPLFPLNYESLLVYFNRSRV